MQPTSWDALFQAWASAERHGDMPVALCATHRLAERVARDYAQQRHAQGDQAWAAPPCFSWSAWLRDTHDALLLKMAQEGRAMPRLLGDAEAIALWRQIIDADAAAKALLQPGQTARLAAQAWQTAHEYRIPLPIGAGDDEDAEAFDRWARRFDQRLDEVQAITASQLPALLAEHIVAGAIAVPAQFNVAALDRPTPAQRHLLDTLRDAGAQLRALENGGESSGVITHLPCSDPESELDVVARAVRDLAAERPDARIGIVVHDLHARREALLRRFDAVLCPWLMPGGDPALRPYAISLGVPLADMPPVAAALEWLDWAATRGGWPLDRASRCLLSPYWHGHAVLHHVVAADHALRDDGLQQLTPAQAARAMHHANPGEEAHTSQSAAALQQHALPTDKALPSAWAARFSTALQAIGWPQASQLGSADFQALQAWNEQLAVFGRLDRLTGALGATAALARLRDALQQFPFQPQGGNANIEVLGLLESAGLDFDELFLVGMDDTAWPPAAAPAPLLPLPLQRQADVAQASVEGQLERARHITAQLLASAARVSVTWSVTLSEQPTRLSPLLPAAQVQPATLSADDEPLWRSLADTARHEPWQDESATPPQRGALVPGGIRRIGEQAECPFRSVAHNDLHAAAPAQPTPAPDALERGQIAHEVMARLWRQLRDSQALHAQTDEQRAESVADTVAEVLAAWQRRRPQRFTDGVLAVETPRMQRHALAMLQADLPRAAFCVEMVEGQDSGREGDATRGGRIEVDVFGLRLAVTPDRIDHVPDAGRIVIDYKTGVARQPIGAQLSAPQLPIYADLAEDCIAVAYATLRAGTTGYTGVIDNDCQDALPALTRVEKLHHQTRQHLQYSDWDGLRAHWHAQLSALSDDILRGDARVAPLQGVCARCDLHTLCRVHESDLADSNGEEGAAP